MIYWIYNEIFTMIACRRHPFDRPYGDVIPRSPLTELLKFSGKGYSSEPDLESI